MLPLLGFGAMVAGGAAAYYYYNTTQEPQPLPATPTPELKLKEEPPKLNEEAQEAAPIGAGFQDLGGAPAEACGSQSGLGSDASEHQEEEDVESSESTSAAEATEEEPGPAKQKMEDEEADADVEEMRVASEELRMQAEVVTGLLNEVLAGGTGLLQAAAEGEDQLPAVKEDEEESDASQSEAVVVLKAQIQEEKERLAEAEARLEEAKVCWRVLAVLHSLHDLQQIFQLSARRVRNSEITQEQRDETNCKYRDGRALVRERP